MLIGYSLIVESILKESPLSEGERVGHVGIEPTLFPPERTQRRGE